MKLRIARHTTNLNQLFEFYNKILSLQKLGEFNDHDGYDGVFLGRMDQNWELEFTTSGEVPEHSYDQDDLLVFYVSRNELIEIATKLDLHHIERCIPTNPYWTKMGIHFKDPDGFGIVVALASKESIS